MCSIAPSASARVRSFPAPIFFKVSWVIEVRTGSSIRPSLRNGTRVFSTRTPHKFSAAVRAHMLHLSATIRAKRALVRADVSLAVVGQRLAALLTAQLHFQWRMRSPPLTRGSSDGLTIRRTDDSGHVADPVIFRRQRCWEWLPHSLARLFSYR